MLYSSFAYADPENNVQRAEELAKTVCVTCHGANGISPAPQWPNLAGQKYDYMVDEMIRFKEKKAH